MSSRVVARRCIRSTERIDVGREQTDTDKMYARLQGLALRAECDQQYDPPVEEAYMDYKSPIFQESVKFLFVLALGLTAVTFWRSVR